MIVFYRMHIHHLHSSSVVFVSLRAPTFLDLLVRKCRESRVANSLFPTHGARLSSVPRLDEAIVIIPFKNILLYCPYPPADRVFRSHKTLIAHFFLMGFVGCWYLDYPHSRHTHLRNTQWIGTKTPQWHLSQSPLAYENMEDGCTEQTIEEADMVEGDLVVRNHTEMMLTGQIMRGHHQGAMWVVARQHRARAFWSWYAA